MQGKSPFPEQGEEFFSRETRWPLEDKKFDKDRGGILKNRLNFFVILTFGFHRIRETCPGGGCCFQSSSHQGAKNPGLMCLPEFSLTGNRVCGSCQAFRNWIPAIRVPPSRDPANSYKLLHFPFSGRGGFAVIHPFEIKQLFHAAARFFTSVFKCRRDGGTN